MGGRPGLVAAASASKAGWGGPWCPLYTALHAFMHVRRKGGIGNDNREWKGKEGKGTEVEEAKKAAVQRGARSVAVSSRRSQGKSRSGAQPDR